MSTNNNDGVALLQGKAFGRPPASLRDDREIARWVRRAVKNVDPKARHEEPDYQLVCFLVGSAVVGPDETRIANILGIPTSAALLWAANLRRNGVWQDGKVDSEPWYDEESGMARFIGDTLVADGRVKRCLNEAGVAVYDVAGSWEWQGN